jgi:hypothetical protein
LCEFAHERSLTVLYDELGMSRHSAVSDLDAACQYDKSARRDFAGRDDAVARGIGFELAEPPQPTDLRRFQHGEHLIASGFDQRMSRLRHDFPHGQAGDRLIRAFGREPLVPARCEAGRHLGRITNRCAAWPNAKRFVAIAICSPQ